MFISRHAYPLILWPYTVHYHLCLLNFMYRKWRYLWCYFFFPERNIQGYYLDLPLSHFDDTCGPCTCKHYFLPCALAEATHNAVYSTSIADEVSWPCKHTQPFPFAPGSMTHCYCKSSICSSNYSRCLLYILVILVNLLPSGSLLGGISINQISFTIIMTAIM